MKTGKKRSKKEEEFTSDDTRTEQRSMEERLRDSAEKKLASSTDVPPDMTGQVTEALVHELQVQRVQLEMQADELMGARHELEKSQIKYIDLYEYAPVGYLTLDDRAVVTEANLTSATLLGVERNVLVNREFGFFVAPGDRDQFDRYFTDVLDRAGKKTCTLMIRQTDGRVFPARLEGVRITGGEAVTVRITISDITDIWQIEALKESEVKYHNVITNTPAGYFRIDAEGRFQEVNDAWLRMHGFSSRDEVIGRHFSLTQVDPDQQLAQDNVNDIIRGGRVPSGGFTRRMKDGSVGYHTFSAVPVTKNGKIVGIEGFLIDITERRLAEEERRHASERLSLATQSGLVGIWELDTVNNILTWDDQMFRLYGITPGEFNGTYEAWRAGVHPEDLPRSEAELQMAVRGEKEFNTEFRVVWPDGTVHYIHASARVHRDESGKPVSLLGTNYDVTELRQAGEALRESEERYRALVENHTDIIMRFDREHRHLFVNSAVTSVVSLKPADFIGKTHRELEFPKDLCDFMENSIDRVFETKHPFDTEFSYTGLTGRVVFNWLLIPEFEPGGSVSTVLTISRDVTRRKLVDDALKESEELFRKIFENSPLGMALVTPDFRFFSVNPAWIAMTGYSEEELLKRSFKDITHPDHLAGDMESIQELVAGTIPVYSTEKRYIRKDGIILWGSLRVTTIRDQQGSVRYFVAQIEDITERRRAENAIRESEEKLTVVIDGVPTLIAYVDADLRFVYMNKAYADWYGRQREELIGARVRDLLDKDVFERALPAYQAVLSGKTVSFENSVPDKEGKERFISVRLVPHFSGEQVSGFFASVMDITDLRQAEMARDESRHFVQQILDTTPDLIYIYDIREHRNTYTNREVANFLGYSSDEIISMGPRLFEIILHPDDAERVACHHAQLAGSGDEDLLELEYRMKNADGRWRWLRSRDTIFARDTAGVPIQILGVTDDITDQKNATEAIRETGAYTRSLIEASLDPLATITADGKISDVNAATEHATGYSRAEMIGTDFSDYFIDPAKARAGYHQVFEKGTIRDFPLEIRHRDGYIMPVLYNATMYRDSSGSIQGVFATARDITYLKAAQDALQESEQKYRDLSELMPQTIFETDLCGRFTYANRFAFNQFGYDPGELEKGLDISQMVVPEDADRARRNLADIAHGKKSGNEYRFLLKNGNTFTGITYLSVIEKDGQPAGFRGIIVDITERKHNEDVLRLSHFLLDSANRTRELPALLQSYIPVIKEYSGCEAIGIRILDEKGNIPYQAYTGFPEEFYATESPLSIKSDECMCIYVIRGTTDPTQPFFTPGGSFYMNGTTKFLATVSEEARGHTRNVCNLTGYESVALVPIRQGDTIIGLVHLADRRENMVPLTTVQVIEEIANPMGSAIQRVTAEKQVRESLEEKEVLLREIHHRVKNNLARVISLIGLQKAQLSDPEDVARFRDLESRIRSMSLVHESLYHSRSFSRINVQTYVEDLVQHLIQSYGPRAEIRWEIRMGDVVLPIDTAIHCGLIITEIVTNSLKYAFPEGWSCRKERGEECRISLSMNEKDGFIILNASDNGRGIPPGAVVPGPRSLGLSLIRILAKNQLHGDLEMDTTHGTSFVVRFVKKPDRESDFYAG